MYQIIGMYLESEHKNKKLGSFTAHRLKYKFQANMKIIILRLIFQSKKHLEDK